jgi:FtsP/CotA-like multicopper oxidase with cupredoxin domain
MQYGMSWYHSHYSLQCNYGHNCQGEANRNRHKRCKWYGRTLFLIIELMITGAIHIKGPTSGNYDEDLGPWLMSDWYHSDAFELYPTEILTPQAPIPETSVLNGKGVFNCTPSNDTRCTGKQDYYSVTFQKGKNYKIGLVNTGSLLTYKFWIDGHNFTVVQNDFVPIKPYQTDVLAIGIGTSTSPYRRG